MTTYKDSVWVNKGLKSYGSAKRIKKNVIRAGVIGACLVTPCTNWAIPIVPKVIKKDLVYRYERKKK